MIKTQEDSTSSTLFSLFVFVGPDKQAQERLILFSVLLAAMFIQIFPRRWATYIYFNAEHLYPPLIPNPLPRIPESLECEFFVQGNIILISLLPFILNYIRLGSKLHSMWSQATATMAAVQVLRPFFYIPMSYLYPITNGTLKCISREVHSRPLPPCGDMMYSGHFAMLMSALLVNLEFNGYLLSYAENCQMICGLMGFVVLNFVLIWMKRSHNAEDMIAASIVTSAIYLMIRKYRIAKEKNQNECTSDEDETFMKV